MAFDPALVTAYAGLAPSVHNTQPWTISATGDAVTIHADRSRQLHYLDPDGRQLLISCGVATEFALLAVRSQGRACTAQVFPRPDDPDLVAILHIGSSQPPASDELALAAAIPRRYTDRRPYAEAPVATAEVAQLRHAAEGRGAWLHRVNGTERTAVGAIIADAEDDEAADPTYAAELSTWTRPNGEDGLRPESLGMDWPLEVVNDMPLRDFGGHAQHRHPSAGPPPRVERDTVLVLGTPGDDPSAWVAAGRALGGLLLSATTAGLTAQPLGPATDFPLARRRLRRELGLVGYPQLVLRLGYGRDRPRSRRRTTVQEGVAT